MSLALVVAVVAVRAAGQSGGAVFRAETHVTGRVHELAVGDVNGDGLLDVVTCNFDECVTPASLTVLLGGGAGELSEGTTPYTLSISGAPPDERLLG